MHISENDRGVPGTGSVAWDGTFAALRDIGCDGWLTVEAFGNFLPDLAAATKIWRKLFESEDELAAGAYSFLAHHWERSSRGAEAIAEFGTRVSRLASDQVRTRR